MSNGRIIGGIVGALATALGLSIALGSKKASASSLKGSNVSDPGYPEGVWVPIIGSLIASDDRYSRIKLAAARAWGREESDWSPCAIGEPGQVAEDGSNQFPREQGLGQLYNPDDFRKLKIDPGSLRVYCKPGTQQRTRALTEQEMIDQVRYTILEPMLWGLEYADEAVKTYGLAWADADYWKLVKVLHAYKPILAQGMPAVVHKLGRAPVSWVEFRQVLGMDDPSIRAKALATHHGGPPLTEHEKILWGWMRALDNCEAIGNAVAGNGVV